MSIAEMIRNRKGKMKAWRIESAINIDNGGITYTLWHYSTPMLMWFELRKVWTITYMDTGHGSKSDQNGMNIAFRTLGAPYYFSRAGGATIDRIGY